MRFTSSQLHVIVTLGFCGLVSAADNWFVSPALPAIASGLNVAASAAAVILSAYLVPYGVLQPVCGTIGDRLGRLRVLRVIVAGLAIGTFLCALCPTLPFLIAARILTGCFAAGIISVAQAFVGNVVGHENRGAAVGLLMGITFTGQGLSSGLGGIITDLISWRAAFCCFGVLALIALAGLFTLREPVLTLKTKSRDALNNPTMPTKSSSHISEAQKPFLTRALRLFFGPHRAVFLTACTTGIAFLGIYGFMGTFLSERCGLGSTEAGLIMMLYGVMCLVGGALSGKIGASGGPLRVIAVGETSGLIAVGALIAVSLVGAWPVALLAAGALGMGYILVQPTLVSLSMDADPTQAGLCTGLVGLGVFAGGGVGSSIGSIIVAAGGYLGLWIAGGVLMFLQVVLGGIALRRFMRKN